MKNILSWIEENKQQFEGQEPRNMAHGGIIPPEKPKLPQLKIFADKLKTYLNAGAIKKDYATQLLKDKMEELGVSDAELGTITGRRGEAQGGRIGYDDGQLVRNTVDGSRPGYKGEVTYERKWDSERYNTVKDINDLNLKKEKVKLNTLDFKTGNVRISNDLGKKYVQEYLDFVEKSYLNNDMSKVDRFKTFIKNKYPKNHANIISNVNESGYRNMIDVGYKYKRKLANEIITASNNQLKYINKFDVLNKLINPNRVAQLRDQGITKAGEWMDKNTLKSFGSLDKMEDKLSKSLTHIVENNLEIIDPKKVKIPGSGAAGYETVSPIKKMIHYLAGGGSRNELKKALEQNEWYRSQNFKVGKTTKNTFDYLSQAYSTDFIGENFNDAYEFAKTRRGTVNVTGIKGQPLPETLIWKSVARSADRNFKDGVKVKDWPVQILDKNGDPIKFADLPVDDKGVRIIDANKYDFKYGGKIFNKNTLRTNGPKTGLFDEVYKISGTWSEYLKTDVTNPNNPKGPKIKFSKLLEDSGIEKFMAIGHDDALGGVKNKPFSNFRILNKYVNQSLDSAYRHIKNKDLRKRIANEIYGDLKGKTGVDYKNAWIDQNTKLLNDIRKGAGDSITPYRRGATDIIERSPEWMKWSSRKQAELFRVAGVSAKDFNALNNAKPNEKISMLKKMGFKCRMAGGAGESVDCYMKDVGETNKLAKQGNKHAIKKLGNAFDIGKELPKMGKILRQGLQIGLAGPAKLLEWSGLGTWGGLLLEGAVEGGIYKYYKDYKGYTHDQALAETFTPGLLAGRPEDVPWYGGAEQKLEKELYEVKDAEGNIRIKQNVKDFIDTQRKMDQIGTEYDKLESKKKDINEMRGYASQYVDTDYAHPRLDPRVGIENKQKALENEYLKLEQLNKPDALSGNYNAWLAAKEKQDTEQGLRVAKATKKRLGVVDIPWDILNPNEMQKEYKIKPYERAQERWEKEQAEKRYRQMREKFPGYSDKQIDEILTYYGQKKPDSLTYDQISDIFLDQDKISYFADNFRMEKAGGGMVGIRKPHAIAPTGGPQSQGLASTPEYDTYSKEYKWQI
jgi:hypothetical protein